MDLKNTLRLAEYFRQYRPSDSGQCAIEIVVPAGPLRKFHQWVDGRPCEGAFLVRSTGVGALWVLLLDWKLSGEYYLVLFPENKAGPLAELHRLVIAGSAPEELELHWKYSPTKRDRKNAERRAYFADAFLSDDVVIAFPNAIDEVEGLIVELLALVACRRKADALDNERPLPREGFPEGKLKERLHYERERNPSLIREAKAIALNRDGCLRCECCKFDFKSVYGELGIGYIEAHHTKPVSALHADGDFTRVEDLALVCSNCHRMLHRRRPWLGSDDLRRLIDR
jgi:hypothetical protein